MDYPEPEIAEPVEANCIYINYSEYLLLFTGSGIGWFLIGYYIPDVIYKLCRLPAGNRMLDSTEVRNQPIIARRVVE